MWMYGYRIFLEIVLVTYYLLARGALLTTGNFTYVKDWNESAKIINKNILAK